MNDVPLSITAATGDQLTKAGVTTPAELVKLVPGFTFQPSNFNTPVFGIRGIAFTDTSTGVAPTVSVYVDQVPLPYSVMTPGVTLDVERVEVLKGPQGTLFGQNATGGAINFIAAKPTSSLSAGASAELARFGQVNLDGYISGPVSDTLSLRLTAKTEQGGAWQRSVTRPGDELGSRDFTAGRFIADWKPSDSVRLEFNANGFLDKSDTLAAQYVRLAPTAQTPLVPLLRQMVAANGNVPAPRDPRAADWVGIDDHATDISFFQFSLNGEIDLSDNITLTSISAYSNMDYEALRDPSGLNFGNIVNKSISKIETFSQELRLSGTISEDRLKWMVGGFYGYNDAKETQLGSVDISSNTVTPTGRWFNASVALPFSLANPTLTSTTPLPFTPSFSILNNQKVKTYAGFASLDYKLSDQIAILGSGRFTQSNNDAEGCVADIGDGRFAGALGGLPGQCQTLNLATFVRGLQRVPLHEDNFSWRGNISWTPARDILLYANVTKGYKAGAFSTLPILVAAQYVPVKQESILAYEAGFKVALDRTINVTGAVFHYDYSDKQIGGYYFIPPFGLLPGLISIPKSRVTGGELNIDWRPAPGLRLNGSGTYVGSKVRRGTAYDPLANLIDITGSTFPNSPKWQLSGDAEYGFPIGDHRAFAGVNIRYRSSTPAAFGNVPDFELPNHTIVDLRAGIETSDGRWSAQIWGRNIFNTFYVTNVSHVIDSIARTTGMPATYGVKLSLKY